LERRHAEKQPVKCTVELSHTIKSYEIAQSLASSGRESLFHVMTPADVVTTVLSRAILDFAYYSIYLELFSFENRSIYFINPKRFMAQGLPEGLPFEELCMRFTQGVLIGYSCATASGVDVLLAPLGRPLQSGEWLLFIAPNEASATYATAPTPRPLEAPAIQIPSLTRHCRVCLIGAARRFGHISDLLDPASRKVFHENHLVLATPEEYFDPAFIQRLVDGGFDKIIINLNDDLAFRLSLYLRGLFGPDDPFVQKIITVLNDPVTENLLTRRGSHRNIILSDKLAAKYIAQLAFQKNLEKVYLELASRDKTEIKLLDVDVHIPRAALANKQQVKQLLLMHGLIYLGTVNAEKECFFDAEDFANACQIVVISPQTAT
jgi:hypothetical protein